MTADAESPHYIPFTLDQLRLIMPLAGFRAQTFIAPLNEAMRDAQIDTHPRQSAFLAQIAHESGQLRYTAEIATGDAYEGRHDLGNVRPGDGRRFKGRGLIQITGRENYAQASRALGIDFVLSPQLMELPASAARVSTWFWTMKNLNADADRDAFEIITRKINGGLNGWADRCDFWERAKHTLLANYSTIRS